MTLNKKTFDEDGEWGWAYDDFAGRWPPIRREDETPTHAPLGSQPTCTAPQETSLAAPSDLVVGRANSWLAREGPSHRSREEREARYAGWAGRAKSSPKGKIGVKGKIGKSSGSMKGKGGESTGNEGADTSKGST